MLLVTYADPEPRVGVIAAGRLLDLAEIGADSGSPEVAVAPPSMNELIDHWDAWQAPVRAAVARLERDPSAGGRPSDGVRLLAPIPRPRRNPFLLAGNYMDHVLAGERASGIPLTQRKTAIFFTKPTGAVTGPTDDVEVDTRLTQRVDYETELVIVIGRRGRDIPYDDAMRYVFGYTVGNDISARDIQRQKPTTDFLRGKGLDTFFPTGPGIVPVDTLPDYRTLTLRTFVNGEQRQDTTLDMMIRDVPEIIADLSRGLTLEPGDLIATGTPSGVQSEKDEPDWLKDGDELVSEIEGIGRLVNRIRKIA
jgi:2-keto-4-pentenoate hydratase/2-oxohepta-3-ene-1,7-dioic acid hydratase in catechol pathway